jgi:hypothetical protein
VSLENDGAACDALVDREDESHDNTKRPVFKSDIQRAGPTYERTVVL